MKQRSHNFRLSLFAFCLLFPIGVFAQAPDSDGDGIEDAKDNCTLTPNFFVADPSNNPAVNPQRDSDFDAFGNACDGDLNNDGYTTTVDFGVFLGCFLQFVPGNNTSSWPTDDPSCFESDMDASGFVDEADFDLFLASFIAGVPGPTGVACAAPIIPGIMINRCLPIDLLTNPQIPDPYYYPNLENPFYAAAGPKVKIDSTHANFHQIDFRYQSFSRLLSADGYQVSGFDTSYSAACVANPNCNYIQALLDTDILVIANARVPISAAEAELIVDWVEGSLGCESGCSLRSLLLIADHQTNGTPTFNFPAQITELSNRLALNWPNNNSSGNITYSPDELDPEGFLDPDHAIVAGRTGFDEYVTSVTAFFGSVFVGTAPETVDGSIMILPEDAQWTDEFGNAFSAAGWSQGAAFAVGTGRVYASGEAGMFTSQVSLLNFFGMARLGRNQNQQYLLNLMHWLNNDL